MMVPREAVGGWGLGLGTETRDRCVKRDVRYRIMVGGVDVNLGTNKSTFRSITIKHRNQLIYQI